MESYERNSRERRHPLEKVDWNFLSENPEELLKIFSKKLKNPDGENYYARIFVAPRDKYPELDGWILAFSKDYEEYKKNGGKEALVVRRFNDKYGKGASLIVFPPAGEGNANLRRFEVTENLGVQAKLVEGVPLKDKGDATESIRVL